MPVRNRGTVGPWIVCHSPCFALAGLRAVVCAELNGGASSSSGWAQEIAARRSAVNKPALAPSARESTSSVIATMLREAIGSGRLVPGSQLGEKDLAKQLGISRGPLREATQRLAQEGLLVLFVIEASSFSSRRGATDATSIWRDRRSNAPPHARSYSLTPCHRRRRGRVTL
jgi:Bacterial regulatory proteins, gntR family